MPIFGVTLYILAAGIIRHTYGTYSVIQHGFKQACGVG